MTTREIETRSVSQPISRSGRRIVGLTSPYNVKSHLMNGMREVVHRSMWNKSAADGWNGLGAGVLAKFEHRDPLGSTRNKTLSLDHNRRDGLGYEIQVARTHVGDDALEYVDSGIAPFSSWGMQVFDDDFQWDGGIMVRHLISGLLTEVTITSQPAYPSTEAVCRSLASQFGEDPADVVELYHQGELRSLVARTDLAVAATPTVLPSVPTPLEVAQRSTETAGDGGGASNELQAKLLAHMRRKNSWDAPHLADGAGMLDLYRRRVQLHENGEQRSAVAVVDGYDGRPTWR
jgi:phage head maturation protease